MTTGPPSRFYGTRDILESHSSSVVRSAQHALRLLGGKWVVPILDALASRPQRHGELRKALGSGLHEKVMTETLRRMESAQLLTREARPGIPPFVLYALTDLGRSLLQLVEQLAAWTDSHEDTSQDDTQTAAESSTAAG